MPRWNDPHSLEDLLCTLVGWESSTGSPGEAAFALRLAALLRELPAFTRHPERVTPAAGEASATHVTALHRVDGIADTIVLLSHYDTVDTSEYGVFEPLARDPRRLTAAMVEHVDELDAEPAADATSGAYLFGRGTADMKAGLALHLTLVARADAERWPINLLLLTVSDEEVASIGMRDAVEHLEALAVEHGLRYVLALNGEPSFPAHPGDDDHHVYTGSIGKLLPTSLCVGRETHAGTPLAGLSSSYMASFLARELEWCDDFHEEVRGESTPPPVTLWQRDLREAYSTQTTSRTASFHNVFVMRRSAEDVLRRFTDVAQRAADACNEHYGALCARAGIEPIGSVRVLRFEELLAHAREHVGDEETARLLAGDGIDPDEDLCVQAVRVADALAVACPELAPLIVVLFTPPYYPPVDSADDPFVRACVDRVVATASAHFGRELHHQHWFSAISDLSYARHAEDDQDGWQAYERNTPGYGERYRIPFAAMQRLDIPVLNVGPRGKDLHMRTERLHRVSAFEELPALLADLVQFVAAETATRD